MSNEILTVLEYMEKEKGISREDMVSTIASAIRNAAQKGINAGQELKIEINPKNGALKAWAELRVVDSVSDPANEIHVEKAHQIDPDVQVGETVLREIDPSYLGRIAAQTARQAIMQRIRQFEKERIYHDYKDTVGDIVSGTVRRRERGDLIIDLGKAEAILPPRERVPGEDYSPGERIRCLLLNIETTPRGPELVLSRASSKFVRRLFEVEVTEIGDGTVSIESMAREPGYRSKIAVASRDPKVDPVGACVGARGARVKSIVRELNGEKVDIIPWYSDPERFLEEAIKPAVPRNVRVDHEHRRIYFEVSEDKLSVAIGRKGQNAKLTSRLLGWKLDIGKERSLSGNFDDRRQSAIFGLRDRLNIRIEHATALVDGGLTTIEAFDGLEVNDLLPLGFDEESATMVLRKAAAARG
ncbi:MAG: transcription termination factor NusA [Opitutales bacterium]